jgi:hypothetical protein
MLSFNCFIGMHTAFLLRETARVSRAEHIVSLQHYRAFLLSGLWPASKATASGGGRLLPPLFTIMY